MCHTCWTIFQDNLTFAFGCGGLVVYIAVLTVLIRYSKTTFKSPFFKFCISLGFVEIIALVNDIVKPSVSEYMKQNRDDHLFQRVYGGLSRIPWFAVLYHQFYIAVERVTALLYTKAHDKVGVR